MTEPTFRKTHFAIIEVCVDTECTEYLDAFEAAHKMANLLTLENIRYINVKEVEEVYEREGKNDSQ